MSDRSQVESLLRAAARDIKAVQLIGAASDLDEIIGFHTQQAAEKLLKAWIAFKGRSYPITHNIDHLLNALARSGETVERFRPLAEYTPFAVRYRYDATIEALDRTKAMSRLTALLEHVRGLLAATD